MSVDLQINSKPVKSILIVEDNQMLLELLTKGFKMFGMDVFTADNGLDGWSLFNSDTVDVVLTDICMPGLDGIELSRRIRNASPHTTIAVMTGADDDTARALVADGIADHLFFKPFPLGSVCKSLVAEAQAAV
jgi:DNA-binding response OmpR family regulator